MAHHHTAKTRTAKPIDSNAAFGSRAGVKEKAEGIAIAKRTTIQEMQALKTKITDSIKKSELKKGRCLWSVSDYANLIAGNASNTHLTNAQSEAIFNCVHPEDCFEIIKYVLSLESGLSGKVDESNLKYSLQAAATCGSFFLSPEQKFALLDTLLASKIEAIHETAARIVGKVPEGSITGAFSKVLSSDFFHPRVAAVENISKLPTNLQPDVLRIALGNNALEIVVLSLQAIAALPTDTKDSLHAEYFDSLKRAAKGNEHSTYKAMELMSWLPTPQQAEIICICLRPISSGHQTLKKAVELADALPEKLKTPEIRGKLEKYRPWVTPR